ncbi:MAG: potassium channel family protein [Acidimicrobiales bacterium]
MSSERISLLAKQEFAVPRVVARVNTPENQWLFNDSWGVDVSVSTPALLTSLVEEAVSVGSLVPLLELGDGETHLVEVTLAAGSPVAGKALADLELPRDATVVAVVRKSRVVPPRAEIELATGDEILLLATTDAEEAVYRLLVGS